MEEPLLSTSSFLCSVQEIISKQYFLHTIFKVGQGWSTFRGNVSIFHVKNSLFIKISRDPVILGPLREMNDNESVLDKFFVFCELFMDNFAIKKYVIFVLFLLLVLNEGQSLGCSNQHNTFTAAKNCPEILFPYKNVRNISHVCNSSQPTLKIIHKSPTFSAVAFSVQKQRAFHCKHEIMGEDTNTGIG